MEKGYISSVEPMGLVDGPGLRYVVFMQGCSLRCIYCHNPETWQMNTSTLMDSDELLNKILHYKNYYTHGGVTFSGGEPLMQPLFLLEVLKKCKINNLHTALDTAGVGIGYYEEILKYTDLVILDIKAIDEKMYQQITGRSIDKFNEFLEIVKKLNKKLWIRTVIVPNINDNKEYILALNKYLQNICNIQKVELLPYHLYGVDKYKQLNIKYKLENVGPLSEEKLKYLNSYLEY